VILVEGEQSPNGLSVARCLAKHGIKVYGLCLPGSYLRHSRACTWIPQTMAGKTIEEFTDFLLGPASDGLRGAVLLACYDPALQMIARNHDRLRQKYLLDECNPPAQLSMLDKLATFRAAVEAGVPTPKFWVVQGKDQVLHHREELVYPLLVKPLLSHVYRAKFGKKFTVAANFEELLPAFEQAAAANVEVMLVEQIPGPDDRLCSYYTYLDGDGNALFDFTKRVVRRYPVNMGPGCYHITDWVPGVKEPALRLFRHVGLRGLANAEFKRDDRDGQLKLIECNARFTGGNGLVAASGYDLASFVYNRIVGLPEKPFGRFTLGKRLWHPVEDFYAYRQLSARKELTFWGWLKSLAHPMVLPYFRWTDPWPTLVYEGGRLKQGLIRRLGRWLPVLSGKADRKD
jgi:predicted ATP-grasp superfamily ATP-dependent carboligase